MVHIGGVTTIALDGANRHLTTAHDGSALIERAIRTGERLVRAPDAAGRQPHSLRRIVLTHGDIDHTGNAAYLRKRTGARIALHPRCLVCLVLRGWKRFLPPAESPAPSPQDVGLGHVVLQTRVGHHGLADRWSFGFDSPWLTSRESSKPCKEPAAPTGEQARNI